MSREHVLREALETAFIALERAGGNTLSSPYRTAWEKARAALVLFWAAQPRPLTDVEVLTWFIGTYGSITAKDEHGRCVCFHQGRGFLDTPLNGGSVGRICLECGAGWTEHTEITPPTKAVKP